MRNRNQARKQGLGFKVWATTGLVTSCSGKGWERNRKLYTQ